MTRQDDRISSGKELAGVATDLTDGEVKRTVDLINKTRLKYAGRANTSENLEELRDEVLYKLAEMDILAEFDPSPCFYGEPPILEIRGKISTDPIHKHGFDHERKEYEVKKSLDRKEDYLGQKEPYNTPRKATDA